jgi:DNA-binding transcriptional LysR family regulator
MHNPLDMIVLAKVVELSSFSAAAERLDMSGSVIRKHITRLESSLGVHLLNRTTRRLSHRCRTCCAGALYVDFQGS